MPGDADDPEPYTIAVSARVRDHLQAMGMPDESANDTLERLLGLTPDPATMTGDDLSTPLPDDPVVPDALASDPTADTAAVDPEDVPAAANAPTDVDASLGELAALLPDDDRERATALLEQIADADPEELDGIVESLEDDGGDRTADGDDAATDADDAAADSEDPAADSEDPAADNEDPAADNQGPAADSEDATTDGDDDERDA
jgi:hypothetical protein